MIGKTLGHYQILEKIGQGGMGVVFKARDTHLNRSVAIKVLPPERMADPSRKARFVQEARAASGLNHPNIITIHDISSEGGTDFIAMEYVEGKTLDQLIPRQGMRLSGLLKIAVPLADAMAAAHSAGIIHRDLKPANVMVSDQGLVKVLDFGLAKLTETPASLESRMTAPMEPRSEPGQIAGTAAYMSPEQALGEELDARSDLFSFGVVLYEMATGVLPFRGSSLAATFNAILNATPTAPVRINPDLPGDLERIIEKALEKDRNLRYQHAADMRADLQRLQRDSDSRGSPAVAAPPPMAAARSIKVPLIVSTMVVLAALALVVGLNTGGLRDRLFGAMGERHIESLAVLPLENLSGDPNQEPFANGMTEALITELSKIKALKKVISRTSVMQYKGARKPIRQIAGELDVDALVEGSAIREGNRVRITVQVIDGATDAHLWADSFDREYKDILALHSEVARAIAKEVKAAISPAEAANFSSTAKINPEAYDYYLRGREYYVRGGREQDLRIAIQMFGKAIELDPLFASAYAAVSTSHALMWWYSYDRTEQRVSLAKSAAERALQLQPDLSETHKALGFLYYWCYLDFDRALLEFEVAQRTMPNDSETSWGIGLILRRQGKIEQSLANLKKAFELNPLLSELALHPAFTYAWMRNLAEANRYYDIAIRLSPDRPESYASKAKNILRLAGDIAQAREVIESAERLKLGNDPRIADARDLLDLYAGTAKEAIKRLPAESWEALELRGDVPKALLLAQVHSHAGQPQMEKRFYESAMKMAMAKIRQRPEESFYHSTLGIAYAGLGRKQDALREGRAGVDLTPLSKDAVGGFFRTADMARICTMVGEYDEAIRLLEQLMSIPGDLGIGALRLDPAWKPLRNHPRFQALLRSHEKH